MAKTKRIGKDRLLELLRSHDFTHNMPAAHLAKIAGFAQLVQINQDELVFSSGQRPRSFYLLLSGTVFLEMHTPTYTICIEQLQGGEAFGWPALVDNPYRAFQVRAQEPCMAVRIRADRLRSACNGDSKLGFHVFRMLASLIARRLRSTELRLAEFIGPPVKKDCAAPSSSRLGV